MSHNVGVLAYIRWMLFCRYPQHNSKIPRWKILCPFSWIFNYAYVLCRSTVYFELPFETSVVTVIHLVLIWSTFRNIINWKLPYQLWRKYITDWWYVMVFRILAEDFKHIHISWYGNTQLCQSNVLSSHLIDALLYKNNFIRTMSLDFRPTFSSLS